MKTPARTLDSKPAPAEALRLRWSQTLRYVALARPHHYGKNILVLAGVLLALLHRPASVAPPAAFEILTALIATCLIASSYYVLNELRDAPSDRFHPKKCDRPLVAGHVSPAIACALWVTLGMLGLGVSASVNRSFLATAATLTMMGLAYNVPPLRLKDVPYLDVLSESINSPLRLLLGWFVVLPLQFPPVALILLFWMAGAFLMAWKRLRELRVLRDPQLAAAYRKSFTYYNEGRLRASMLFYTVAALLSALQLGAMWPS